MTTLPAPAINTPKGTRVAVQITEGYVNHSQRPYECCHWAPDPNNRGNYSIGCKCGTCNGTKRIVTGTYEGTIDYADNSLEGTIALDEPKANGHTYHTVRFAGPSGDICF